jgi:hypothetical protein
MDRSEARCHDRNKPLKRSSSAAAMEIEHFVESLRTTQREQREKVVGRAPFAAIGAVGGIALTKAVDWIPTLLHH